MPRNAATEVAYTLDAVPPYRLDLTAAVLRRFSTNLVDRYEAGIYRRALTGFTAPLAVSVRHTAPATLAVTVSGPPGEGERAVALARRMLGTDRDLTPWDAAAARVPWLRELASRMRGVKPPRYPTLWEACTNAIVFQQISLVAASAIMGRLIVALGTPVDGGTLHAFPGPDRILGAEDGTLRTAGLSAAKVAALRDVAAALESGLLDEAMLEARDVSDAIALLCERRGIGAWTATVILLRGLGRLDVFPPGDSGAARGLAALAAGHAVDLPKTLRMLGEQRGMLYYHLLLARLEALGEVIP